MVPMNKVLVLSTAVLAGALAQAADPPPLKEGLWEIHGHSVENPGGRETDFTYRLCRNHQFDDAMNAQAKNAKECNTSFDDLGGGKYASSSTCLVPGTAIVSKGTYTYESSTAARSESHATYTPAFHGKSEETITEDQKYVGRCPSNMKPGDRILSDGTLQRFVGG
jgi:hypothetical protein